MENSLNLRGKGISQTSVQVLWSYKGDCEIEKYQLHYKPSNSDNITYRKIMPERSNFEITNLHPDTEYYISLTPYSMNRKLKPSVTSVRTLRSCQTVITPRIRDARMLTKTVSIRKLF